MIDRYITNIEKGSKLLDDLELLHAFIFSKKTINGGISDSDYVYLENIRLQLGINDTLMFNELLKKVCDVYFDEYFNRKKN